MTLNLTPQQAAICLDGLDSLFARGFPAVGPGQYPATTRALLTLQLFQQIEMTAMAPLPPPVPTAPAASAPDGSQDAGMP